MEQVTIYKNKDAVNGIAKKEAPKIREDFIAQLEHSLMYLSFKDSNLWHSEELNPFTLKQFDGAWLIDANLRQEKTDGFCLKAFGDLQVAPEMFPDLNLKTLTLDGYTPHLLKNKFLSHSEKRNLYKYKYILSQKQGILDYEKQKWWLTESGYGFNKIENNDNLKSCYLIPTSLKPGFMYPEYQVKKFISDSVNDEEHPYVRAYLAFHYSLQLALTYYYEWSCYIRENENSIGIRIPIHPSSSKEVFIMRNIPEGNSRKKAIVNYVKEHYRKINNCNDQEVEILIKQHFRGELKFNWRGLEVHITPSQYDLKRIKSNLKFNII